MIRIVGPDILNLWAAPVEPGAKEPLVFAVAERINTTRKRVRRAILGRDDFCMNDAAVERAGNLN